MSDLVERMRARLAEKRQAKPERIQENKHNAECSRIFTGTGNTDTSIHRSGISYNGGDYESTTDLPESRIPIHCPGDYESCKTSLRIAAYLTIKSGIYKKQHEKTFIVRSLVGAEFCEKWFSTYCIEPYPDMCSCGQMFLSNAGQLRDHCIVCKGYAPDCHAMDMKWRFAGYREFLRVNLDIHKSWADYSVAWALYFMTQARS